MLLDKLLTFEYSEINISHGRESQLSHAGCLDSRTNYCYQHSSVGSDDHVPTVYLP